MYDERASRLGLKRVYEDDTFLVSFPKSGNTWVRFMLASLRCNTASITFRNIEQHIPDIHRSRRLIDFMARPRLIKSHDPKYECYPRCIYVYRDGRDAMVSYYHYVLQRKRFVGTFSEFLRSDIASSFGGWASHVKRAMDFAFTDPASVLLLQYEKMLDSPGIYVRQLANFINVSIDGTAIADVVRNCSLSKLQENERRYGTVFEDDADLTFFRCGKSQQWPSYFSEDDLKLFYSKADTTLSRLGYRL
jgi:hypothetical protein